MKGMTSIAPASPRKLSDAGTDALLYGNEHQLALAALLGTTPQWTLDPVTGTATLTGNVILRCDVQIIGVEKQDSWEWGWASGNVTAPRAQLARKVRRFGDKFGMAAATVPRLSLDPNDPHHDALRLVEATKIIHGRWTSFMFPVDGMRLYAAIDAPGLRLPAPTAGGVQQNIRLAAASRPGTPGMRAVRSYGRRRNLLHRARKDGSASLLSTRGGAWQLEVSYDVNGHIDQVRRR